ncbi:MAG: hypothetical protein KAZ71_01795 [Bacteroidia bacterium]|nr:hypothetical protein [Bacteroidia bacterium]
MKQLLLICSLTFSIISFAQTNCEFQFKSDSCALSIPQNKEVVEVMEVKIKKNYLVQFIKQDKKNYLKIIVQDNLGFGKKGSLLLLSNKKQIYIKSIELQVINKTSAYFLISLNETYYLENIKELGLTSIVFNEVAEFGIPKADSDQIKKAANCFFNQVSGNIKLPSK